MREMFRLLLDASPVYWWVAAAVVTAVFWAAMVPSMPTARTRRQMALVPLFGSAFIFAELYWADGGSLTLVLGAYTVVLLALVLAVLPFRRRTAALILEFERTGRDVRDASPKEMPRGMLPWMLFMLSAAAALIVAAMSLGQ